MTASIALGLKRRLDNADLHANVGLPVAFCSFVTRFYIFIAYLTFINIAYVYVHTVCVLAANHLGCWHFESANITVPSVEGSHPTLSDSYRG